MVRIVTLLHDAGVAPRLPKSMNFHEKVTLGKSSSQVHSRSPDMIEAVPKETPPT